LRYNERDVCFRISSYQINSDCLGKNGIGIHSISEKAYLLSSIVHSFTWISPIFLEELSSKSHMVKEGAISRNLAIMKMLGNQKLVT